MDEFTMEDFEALDRETERISSRREWAMIFAGWLVEVLAFIWWVTP